MSGSNLLKYVVAKWFCKFGLENVKIIKPGCAFKLLKTLANNLNGSSKTVMVMNEATGRITKLPR